jgi:hypothetical protein
VSVGIPPSRAKFFAGVLEFMERTPEPPAATAFPLPAVRRLIHLCWALQQFALDRPFLLTCRDAGALIGVNYHQAYDWLRSLGQVRPPVLETVKDGIRQKANRYRFIAG